MFADLKKMVRRFFDPLGEETEKLTARVERIEGRMSNAEMAIDDIVKGLRHD